MGKVLELVVIALIVGVIAASIFEEAKNWFQRMSRLSKVTLLAAGLVIAAGLAYLVETASGVTVYRFEIPVPIPTPTVTSTEVQTSNSPLGAAALAIGIIVFVWQFEASNTGKRSTRLVETGSGNRFQLTEETKRIRRSVDLESGVEFTSTENLKHPSRSVIFSILSSLFLYKTAVASVQPSGAILFQLSALLGIFVGQVLTWRILNSGSGFMHHAGTVALALITCAVLFLFIWL